MSEEIKRMDIKEFRELGFLQEVNRLVLHPCGLALEVVIHEDGTEELGGVWDYREDPEGICYGGDGSPSLKKANSVTTEVVRHRDARAKLFRELYPDTLTSDPTIEPVVMDGDEG